MLRKIALFLALAAPAFSQHVTWSGPSTATSGGNYTISVAGTGLTNPYTVVLQKNGNWAGQGTGSASWTGTDHGAQTVTFATNGSDAQGTYFSGTLNVSIALASMTPPSSNDYSGATGANAALKYGDWFSPTIIRPSGNGTGVGFYCVSGYTNWGTLAWKPPGVGTYSFYVSQAADQDHTGNNQDPNVGNIEVYNYGYTLVVNKADQPLPTISANPGTSVTAPATVTLTASGDASAGGYVWSGQASGTGSSISIPFSAPGTYTEYVYSAADSNYSQSPQGSITVTVTGVSYTLTVNDGSGGGPYAAGTNVGISANSHAGLAFDHWSQSGPGSLGAQSANTTFTMGTGDASVTPYFRDVAPPSNPGQPSATSIQTTSISVSWGASSDNIGLAGYFVAKDGDYGHAVFTTATNYTATALAPTSSHTFSVCAEDTSGNLSSWVTSSSITTLPDTQAPSAPTRLRGSSISVTSFNLMWDAAADDVGATQYQVFQNGTLIGTTGNTYFAVTGLTADTTYQYTVKAADAAGNWSGLSLPVAMTTNQAVLVGIHAAGYGTPSGQNLTVTSYENSQGSSYTSPQPLSAAGTGSSSWTAVHQYRGFAPGVNNEVKISGPSYQREVRFEVPAGYTLIINRTVNGSTRSTPYTNTATLDLGNANGASTDSEVIGFMLMPNDGSSALDAAYSIDPELSSSNVVWALSLGRSADGLTLGSLTLRKTDMVGDPMSTDLLKLTGADLGDAVQQLTDAQFGCPWGSARRIIQTRTCYLWLDDHVSGHAQTYVEVKAYDIGATPSWNGTTYDFKKNGVSVAPFAHYSVESKTTTSANDTFVITKNLGQAQQLSWTLVKAISGSSTTWTLQRAGNRTLKVVETVSGSTETDDITLTDGGGTVAQTFRKVYNQYAWGRKELVSETDDPSGFNLTTTYTYGTSGGAYGKLTSVTKPDGTYTAYDYYSDDANYGNLAHTYTPWLDVASTAATASATNAQTVTLTYLPVHGFEADALNSTTTTVPGSSGTVTTAKTVRNPDFTSTTFNGHKVRKETIQAYSDASNSLTTVRLSYHPDETDSDRENQLISQTGPDGTKISTIYYAGLFNNAGDSNTTLFQKNSNAALNTQYGEYTFNGFSTQVAGSQLVSTFDGEAIDPIYLVPNRSTVQLTVVDKGQPAYKVNYVFTGASGGVPSFEFIGSESFVVTTTVDSSTGISTTTKTHSTHRGEQSSQSYTNGRLMTETANDGSVVTYSYDSTGLLAYKKVSGAPSSGNYAAQSDLYTHYTYDAASRKTSEKTSNSSDPAAAGPTISYAYDSAGRLQSQTDPTGLTTTFSYDLANHTETTTAPGGATKIVTKYKDGSVKSVTGTAVTSSYSDVTVNADGTITRTNYALRASDVSNPTSAPRWSRATVDWLGRTVRTEAPAIGGTVATVSTYNAKGELTKVQTIDASSGTTLAADAVTEYDAYEQPYRTGSDLDGTAGLQTTSALDRITDTDADFEKDGSGVWWVVKTTKVYNQASNGTAITTSVVKAQQNKLSTAGTNVQSHSVAIDVFGNQTDTKVAVDRTNLLVTTTTVAPNSSVPAISIVRNGLAQSDQTVTNQVTTYAYDGLRRLVCTSDPRIDGSSLAKDLSPRIGYFDGTAAVGARYQKAWTKDTAGNQTSYAYSATTGRLSSVQSPPLPNQTGKYTYYDYSDRGELVRTWGGTSYPVEYAFDDYGQKVAMRTFRGSDDFTGSTWPLTDSGTTANPAPASWQSGDKTTWAYDNATGVLLSKTDATNQAVSLAYTELGQVRTRTLARGVSLTYRYYGDDAGDPKTGQLKSVDYSDTPNTTPDVSYTYDRLGNTASVTDATGTRSFAYDPASSALSTETLPSFFGSRVLTEKYDTTGVGTKGRNTGFTLTTPTPSTDYDVGYGYDTYGRGQTVTAGGATFTYAYTPSSNLVASVTDSASGYTQTRTWMPNRNQLASIDTKMGTASKATFAYTVDEWGRRTSVIRSGEVYARYINQGLVTTWSNDDRSQVTNAQTFYGTSLSDLSYPVEGRNYTFNFDNIGNRLSSGVDGRTTTYHSNALNQITDKVTPGAVDVAGFAPTGSTVQVNGQPTDRQGDYYHAVASVNNASASVNADITVTSTNPAGSVTRKAFVAKNTLSQPEQWQYDADGNLTRDDEWTYTWNAENRLIAMETRSDLVTTGVFAAADARRIEFTYDYLGRRAEKLVRNGWNGSTYATVLSDTRFVYHGWNLVAELNYSGSTFVLGRSYTWGLDLSGTLAGDGGTGGLLMTQDGSNQYVYAYDGNGNVSAVMNRSGGAPVAEYEYGAFGESLRASNTYAQTNPFRFSTQYVDNETGLSYYGHRYYDPKNGRFLCRDGTEETGGLNLYAFCGNDGIDHWDILGNIPGGSVNTTRQSRLGGGDDGVLDARSPLNRTLENVGADAQNASFLSVCTPTLAAQNELDDGAVIAELNFGIAAQNLANANVRWMNASTGWREPIVVSDVLPSDQGTGSDSGSQPSTVPPGASLTFSDANAAVSPLPSSAAGLIASDANTSGNLATIGTLTASDLTINAPAPLVTGNSTPDLTFNFSMDANGSSASFSTTAPGNDAMAKGYTVASGVQTAVDLSGVADSARLSSGLAAAGVSLSATDVLLGVGIHIALVSTLIDWTGVYNGDLSPTNATVNTAVTVFGFTGPMQATLAAGYALVGALYPGGWLGNGGPAYGGAGAWSDMGTTIERNQKVVPGWNMRTCPPW